MNLSIAINVKNKIYNYLLLLLLLVFSQGLHGGSSYYHVKLLNGLKPNKTEEKKSEEKKTDGKKTDEKRIDFSKPKKKLKILLIETYFPARTSTAALNQITALIDHGHDVYIYAHLKGDMEWAHPDIKQYDLMKRVYYKRVPPDITTFDLIFCQFGYRALEWVNLKKRLGLTAHLVSCFRGADLSRDIQKNREIYNELFKVGALFLPVCDYFKDKLVELGCDVQKIITLYSAIDCDRFAPKSLAKKDISVIKLASVSRLTEKKGLEYAIRAVAQLIPTCDNIRYSIVGFGEQKGNLEALINELGMQQHITMLGRATQDEVAQLLNSIDIFLSPSVTAKGGDQEGIANSLKEAMACGIPVIATHHAGTGELVRDGVCGFMVPEKNVAEIVQKIDFLIRNPQQAAMMGAAGRHIVETKFDKGVLSQRLATIFKERFLRS